MEREVQINKTQYFGDIQITAQGESIMPRRKSGDTAEHEAMHVVAAIFNRTSIDSATIIPGPGYLGLTKLSKADAVAAMAPHSMGKSGTGHDVRIAAMIGSTGAEAAAKGIINSKWEEVQAVAETLEERKTIIHSDATNAIRDARIERFGTGTAYIKNKDGEEKVIKGLRVTDGAVIVPGEVIIFEEANKNPQIH